MTSSEILDKLVKLATRDFGPSVEQLEKKGISINQIKQDLKKYNCAIYLLNQLFEYVDYGSYCLYDIENDEEEIMFQLKTKEYSIDIPYEVYSLMRDLEYGILKEVGDSND